MKLTEAKNIRVGDEASYDMGGEFHTREISDAYINSEGVWVVVGCNEIHHDYIKYATHCYKPWRKSDAPKNHMTFAEAKALKHNDRVWCDDFGDMVTVDSVFVDKKVVWVNLQAKCGFMPHYMLTFSAMEEE